MFSSCFCSSSLFISSFCFSFLSFDGFLLYYNTLEFLSFSFVWIYWMFLICGYPGVQVCWPMTISTCFKLIVIQVQTHSKRSTFFTTLPHILYFWCNYLFIVVTVAFTFFCLLISILLSSVVGPQSLLCIYFFSIGSYFFST